MSYSNYLLKNIDLNFGVCLLEIEELYLLESSLVELKKQLNPNFCSFNFIRYNGKKTTIDQIIDQAQTYPLMDEKKIIVVDNAMKVFNSEDEIKKLENYLKEDVKSTALIFYENGKLDKRKKLYKIFKKKNKVEVIGKLDLLSYRAWIKNYFNKCNIKMEQRFIEHIINRSHYLDKYDDISLYTIENQLIKLSCYKNQITGQIIDLYFDEPTESNIFKMIDATILKKPTQAYKYLSVLEKKNISKRQIYAMLIKKYRLLFHLKRFSNLNKTPKEIMNILSEYNSGEKYNYYNVSNGIQLVKNVPYNNIAKKQKYILDLDYRIKTGRLDIDTALDLIIV